MTTPVWYTCKRCGLRKVRVMIPSRVRGEDVASWMDAVVRLCGASHSRLNPRCPARELDLVIPAADGQPIGSHVPADRQPPEGL